MWIKRFIIFLLLSVCTIAALATPRPFPQNAKSGTFSVSLYPTVLINGESIRMAPGAQIIGKKNTIVMPTALMNTQYYVRYTINSQGAVSKIWILTDEELALAQAIQ